VQLSGSVSDFMPAGASVTLSGAASATTTTDGSGHFTWQGSNASLGTVSAVAVDQAGFSSNPAKTVITDGAPNLTLSISYQGGGKTVVLSGRVSDVDPGGRTLTFSGVVNCCVVTAPDGTFSLTAQASGLGTIQATTTDAWGLTSNTAQVTVSDTAPVITSFKAVEGPMEYWTFSGTVSTAYPGGLEVCLGGLPSLQGKKAEVNADGTFSITVQLQVGEDGTATAQVTDWWGLISAVVYASVQQT
jgi:hypothetical protein